MERFDRNVGLLRRKPAKVLLFVVLAISLPRQLHAQERQITLAEAIDLAVTNNKALETFRLRYEQSQKLVAEAIDFGATEIYYGYDANNFAENDLPLKIIGVQQNLSYPGIYNSQRKINKSHSQIQQIMYDSYRRQLIKDVSREYYTIIMIQNKQMKYNYLDSLYEHFAKAAERRYQLGETNYLETLTAHSKTLQIKTKLAQVRLDLNAVSQKLISLVQVDSITVIPWQELKPLPIILQEVDSTPGAMLKAESQRLADNKLRIEQKKLIPGLSLEYFMGTNAGENAKLYPGYQVGLSVPLWFGPQHIRIQAAKIEKEISITDAADYGIHLRSKQNQLMAEIRKHDEVIRQYNANGKGMAEEIIKFARLAYSNGEIDFYQYIQNLDNATTIELEYLDNLNNYNQAVLELNYLNL